MRLANKTLYINWIKSLWWYWHIWSSHLIYAVIHSPYFEASHSLTTLVKYNHHLVVLPYLKLRFELCSYYCVRTDKHSPTRHNGMLLQLVFIKVSLGADSSSLKIAGLPVVVQNTNPAPLFVWITQCWAYIW